MRQRRIALVATFAFLVLAGCATGSHTKAVASSTESDAGHSALPAALVGTWNGTLGPVSGDSSIGTLTLDIKDDGSFTLTTRRPSGTRTESGVVVANGGTVTLRSSSGKWTSLAHRGDSLYGVMPDPASGYTIQMSAEKDSGALASPPMSR